VKKDTRSYAALSNGGRMALSFLGSGQGDLAFAFFGEVTLDGDAFAAKDRRVPVERTPGGAIVLAEAPAWAELRRVDSNETGDHAVVIAEVTDVGLRTEEPQVLTLKELNLNYGG